MTFNEFSLRSRFHKLNVLAFQRRVSVVALMWLIPLLKTLQNPPFTCNTSCMPQTYARNSAVYHLALECIINLIISCLYTKVTQKKKLKDILICNILTSCQKSDVIVIVSVGCV